MHHMCTVCRMKYPCFTKKNPRLYLVYLCASSCISGIVSPKHITSNIDKTLTDTQLLDCILCRNLSQLSELNHKPMRRTRPLTGQQLQLLDSSVNVGRHVVNKFEKCIKLRRIFAWDKLCGILSTFFAYFCCVFFAYVFGVFSGQSDIVSVCEYFFLVQSHGLGFFEYVFSTFAMNSEEEDLNLQQQKHCIFKNVSRIF